MKKLMIVTIAVLITSPSFARSGGKSFGTSHTRSAYVTRNGTYVAPSHATNPNKSKSDNWTTKGNVNPYSGKAGTKAPF